MDFEKLSKLVPSLNKGTYHQIKYHKQLKTRKGVNERVEKVCELSVRFGIEYRNIGIVKERNGVDNNGHAITGSLNHGVWQKYPYFIQNKGNTLLRCYINPNKNEKTSYFVNGKQVSKQYAENLCTKDQFRTKEILFDINIDSIVDIR